MDNIGFQMKRAHVTVAASVCILAAAVSLTLPIAIRSHRNNERRTGVATALIDLGEQLTLTAGPRDFDFIRSKSRLVPAKLPIDCHLFVRRSFVMPPPEQIVLAYVIDDRGKASAEVVVKPDCNCNVRPLTLTAANPSHADELFFQEGR